VLSRTDAWAVGSTVPAGPGIDRALILHWNGRTWKPVPVPDTGHTKGSALTGVSAGSPRDVWAVGEYQFGREGVRDLSEQRDRAELEPTPGTAHPRGGGLRAQQRDCGPT